ncbi:cyclic AMP-dependent transcription factor ATF-5 [Dromaius novaehollandiae]|uniref:cyclic AMP-dependent transcription factor ATF-5 n=1 Tax=Dromaius novaehollandiae TaxID=8790 RepID=UPI00311EC114
MSLLAPLHPAPGLAPEGTLLPASTLPWRAAGHQQLGAGPEGPFAQGALAGPGFSDWMTERVDFSLLMEPGPGPPPPAPLSDLEAMASLLKRELEQLEDFFLEEPLAPDQAAPGSPGPLAFHFPFGTEPPAPAPLSPLGPGCLEPLALFEPPAPAPPAPGPGPLAPKGDRKQKKRDQNKTAALRYRQRKRAEYEALGDQCQSLEARNRELKEKADSIEREIQYVKDLLIEVYKARSQRLRAS